MYIGRTTDKVDVDVSKWRQNGQIFNILRGDNCMLLAYRP